ncbi:MAG: hypothetical protein WA783_09525 [Phormidesmis sp.]
METLLLFVYFLVVFYVLYKMALSLEKRQEDRVIIHLDKEFLTQQTQDQLNHQKDAKHIKTSVEDIAIGKLKFMALQLTVHKPERPVLQSPKAKDLKKQGLSEEGILNVFAGRVYIRVAPIGQQKLRKIPYLSVAVRNDTSDMHVYVNWDHSSLEIFEEGHRIIRSTPNMPSDLSQPQIFSIINPQSGVNADVTIERNYAYDAEARQMVLASPLIDLEERVELSQMSDPTTDEKNIQPLCTLDLMIGIKHVTEPNSKLINLLVPFVFELEIEPDQIALPPLRWLLRQVGDRNRPKNSWFWATKAPAKKR